MALLTALLPWTKYLQDSHTGSWGTPDVGYTEKVQSILKPSTPLTMQGGSNLWRAPVIASSNINNGGVVDQGPTTAWPTAENANLAVTASGSSEGGGTIPTIPSGMTEEEANAIFGPAFSNLNIWEQQAAEQQPLIQSQLETSKAQAMLPIEQAYAANKAEIGKQQTTIENQRQNALQMARDAFNQIQQRYLSRFGMGTSAGPAAQEILGKETARSIGGIEQQSIQNLGWLADQSIKTEGFYQTEKKNLEGDYQNKLESANQEYRNYLYQIQSRRNELQSAKAQALADARQNFDTNIANLNIQLYMNQLQLDAWRQQQLSYAQQQAQYMPAGYENSALTQALQGLTGQAQNLNTTFNTPVKTQPISTNYQGYYNPIALTEEQKKLYGLA